MFDRQRRVRALAVCVTVTAAGMLTGSGIAHALPSTSEPQLTLNRVIRTSPFTGSTTSVRDNEGSAYVAGNDALWMVEDNGKAAYDINLTTGALRRKISGAAFANAPRLGVGGAAGTARSNDLEALAYDASADVLYALSGSTSATPTAFRLVRDGNLQFQVESWQPLPSEYTAAGWRPADGLLYVANSSTIRTYNFATNTLGSSFSITGLSGITGLDFDDTTGDLIAVNSSERLFRASVVTRTIFPGWNLALSSFGILDSRAVEVVGNQVIVSDGNDYRASDDPLRHAIFVMDVTGPGGTSPTAAFTATPTSGVGPLLVTFTDTSTGSPTSWAWTFGDGGTSTAPSPTHTYTTAGSFTATLRATNTLGSTSASRTVTVSDPPVGATVTLDADSYVNTDSPTKNYGASTVLKLHSPTAEYRPLVKFTLAGFTGAPSSVRLRLFVTDASDRAGNWFSISNSWTETGVTWNTAPLISGAPTASAGVATLGAWVEIDLTPSVTGNGTYSFMASSPSANTAIFSSREGTNPPQVLVTP